MVFYYAFLLLLLAAFPTCLGVYEHIRHETKSNSTWNDLGDGDKLPWFDMGNDTTITSFVGQTTLLHCTVRDIGDRRVSWIRQKDLHVLTSGALTFTGDARFAPRRARDSDVHTLQIRHTQLRDAGRYICQVNLEPKISRSVYLSVREARARIESPRNKEVHVRRRSRVRLTCVVDLGSSQARQQNSNQLGHHNAAAVFWYLDGKVLDWVGQTGPGRGVQVTEDRDRQLVSTLVIEKADLAHAGRFTCAPSYAKPDTVTLHVVDGESRAELQGTGSGSSGGASALPAGAASSSSKSPKITSAGTSLLMALAIIIAKL